MKKKFNNIGKKCRRNVGHNEKHNLQILGIDEGGDYEVNVVDLIFKETIEGNIPK